MTLHMFAVYNISVAAKASGDVYWSSEPGYLEDKNRFLTVNGLYEPVMEMTAGVWQRWRMVYAGFTTDYMRLKMEGCEFKLLAKDGIYINDYPRDIGTIFIASGGRSDVMIRCNSEGEYIMQTHEHVAIKAIVKANDEFIDELNSAETDNFDAVVNLPLQMAELEPWTPPKHVYLPDL